MFLLNGNPLAIDTPFTTPDGTQYPANWIRLSSLEDRSRIGITEAPEPTRADDRFYWNGDINLPKDLDGLKSQFVAQVKSQAGSLLAQTDWYVIRKQDIGTEIPDDVIAKRSAIRVQADALEDSIKAVETVEALASLNMSISIQE